MTRRDADDAESAEPTETGFRPLEDLEPTEVVPRPSGGSPGPPASDGRGARSAAGTGPAATSAGDARLGSWIGPYRLVELLGEGGMGRVYLAEQEEPLQRRVALKIVRTSLSDAVVRARFEAEQAALARMSHPFVAQVFDSGATEQGEPWFVMERVEGQDIEEYCDDRALDVRRRLRLFVDVCAGVQHAHQKAILHRDLKPSNILVTEVEGRPVPKVIDFGVAKALDRTSSSEALTRESVVGTRGYLSPEAVVRSWDQDTRSDVYLLGLVLFELLVGVPAVPGDDDSFLEHLQRIVREDAPTMLQRWDGLAPAEQEELAALRGTSPAGLRRALAGDLNWIVARALAREKEARYASAASLAEDVVRHLEDRPVAAGPPRVLDRVAKTIRRHRVGVLAGFLVLASLLAGLVARTLEAERANREAARANLEADRASQAADRARREAATAEAVTDFLIDLFETNEPDRARGEEVTARELLDRGAEEIRSSLLDEPVTRAAILDTIGSLFNSLGDASEAEGLIVEALEIRRGHLPADSPEIAQSLEHLTMVRTEQGRFEAAEESSRELVEMRERLDSDPALVADALNQRSINLHNLGRYEESERWQRRAIELLEENGLFDDGAWHVALNHLGALQLDTGRFEPAVETLQRALEARERIVGAESDAVGQTLNNLGLALAQMERFEEATAVIERALELREARLGPEHPNLAWGLRLLSLARLETGDLEGAERAALEGLQLREAALGRRHPFTALSLEALAKVRLAQGRIGEAEALARETLSIAGEMLEPDHMAFGYYTHLLGEVLDRAGEADAARRAYREAIERMAASLGEDHPDLREVERDLAELEAPVS